MRTSDRKGKKESEIQYLLNNGWFFLRDFGTTQVLTSLPVDLIMKIDRSYIYSSCIFRERFVPFICQKQCNVGAHVC